MRIVVLRALLLLAMASCGRIGFDIGQDENGVADSQPLAIDSAITPTVDAPTDDIITSGLKLDLDPGNPASYPGTGTAIFDLSPALNHGTLTGTPLFVDDGAGSYFTFDGSDTMFITLGTPSPTGWVFGTAPRTLSAWAYADTLRPAYNVLLSYGKNVTGQGSYLGTSENGAQWNFGGFVSNQTGGATFTGSWVQLTGVWDGTTATLYVDGVRSTESVRPDWDTVPDSDAKLGVDSMNPNEGWTGRIGRTIYYDRALNPAEVLANFDATRGRYGL